MGMNYDNYLHTPHIPAGAVLRHIIDRHDISQRELAKSAGLPPQRLSDFVNGRRRISVAASFLLEKALSIDIKGYFYMLQTNNDIYEAQVDTAHTDSPNLKHIKKSLFWDTDMADIDWRGNSASIIKRIFEYGDRDAVFEASRYYGIDLITETLNSDNDSRFAARRRQNLKMIQDETAH